MNRMMVDVETLDTTPRAAIISVGALVFDENTIIEKCHYVIADVDLKKFDVSWQTIRFWMDQNDEARRPFNERGDAVAMYTALSDVKIMYGAQRCEEVWSHGAAFDIPILDNAYRKLSSKPPWHFRQCRCTRTIFSLTGETVNNTGTLHNALDDCVAQAEAVMRALKSLRAKDE